VLASTSLDALKLTIPSSKEISRIQEDSRIADPFGSHLGTEPGILRCHVILSDRVLKPRYVRRGPNSRRLNFWMAIVQGYQSVWSAGSLLSRVTPQHAPCDGS
jgi:hypothetical protein